MAHNTGIYFIYNDFRVGWKEGIEESKRLNMYRNLIADAFSARRRGSRRSNERHRENPYHPRNHIRHRGPCLHLRDRIPYIGRLPGDIYVKKERFSFYFPITTSI